MHKKIHFDGWNLLSRPTFILVICKIKLSLINNWFIGLQVNYEYYNSLYEIFLCFYLIFKDNLTDEQKQWFIDFYKKLCHVGLEKNKASSRVTTPVIDKDRGGSKVSHQCVWVLGSGYFLHGGIMHGATTDPYHRYPAVISLQRKLYFKSQFIFGYPTKLI